MKCFVYRSRAIYSEYDMVDFQILRTAMEKNTAHQITGFLHREKNYYLQYVEGGDSEIDTLLFNLMEDERHRDVKIFDFQTVRERRFAEWSMGYSTTSITCLNSFLRRTAPGQDPSTVSFDQVVAFLLHISAIQRARFTEEAMRFGRELEGD